MIIRIGGNILWVIIMKASAGTAPYCAIFITLAVEDPPVFFLRIQDHCRSHVPWD